MKSERREKKEKISRQSSWNLFLSFFFRKARNFIELKKTCFFSCHVRDCLTNECVSFSFSFLYVSLNISSGSTCVSLEAVERAFGQAASQLRFAPAKDPNAPTEAEVDLLGRTLVETSRILAAEFKLPVDAIHSGLPLIDTKSTSIGSVCPVPMRNNDDCNPERFRSIDGSCNNLENSHWGAAMSPFRRLIPPQFADGNLHFN